MTTRVRFLYQLALGFDGDVSRHSFTLRCVPQDTLRQRILSEGVAVMPITSLSRSMDSFGNVLVEGTILETHSQFSVSVSGEAELSGGEEPVPECPASENDAMIYRQHSGKTVPGPFIIGFLDSAPRCDCDPLSQAIGLMHRLHSSFHYTKGVTDASTTAEQALSGGEGVCQDYAHILISLLRCRGIPARYVVGLTRGEGESHAWVEVLSEGMWYGLDPTADSSVGGAHVKISHGRDYDDCRINRGVFYGGGVSMQQVHALVEPRRG